MSKLKELREQRAQTHAKVVELLKGNQTSETRQKIDTMLADIETITNDIKRIERSAAAENELRGIAAPGTAPVGGENPDAVQYRNAYGEYLRKGQRGFKHGGGMSDSAHKLLTEKRDYLNSLPVEQRDQAAGTQSITYTEGNVGGYFVPAGFVHDIEKATKYFCPLLDGSVVKIVETSTGAILPWPTSNDTQNAWKIVGEAAQVTEKGTATNYATTGTEPNDFAGDVLASFVPFGAYKGTTGLIRVSLELLQDSAFPIEAFLTEAFSVRLGRGYEYYLTRGSGVNQPTGILTAIAASGAAPVSAVGSSANDGGSGTGVNSIGYGDLVSLIHSVDPSYRRGAKFMLHDSTLAHLKTRLDKYGRPLWVPSVREGEPDRIAGYQYVINQCMPQIGASASTVAFGDFSKFIVRKVKDLQVLRLDERFADYGQVAYVAFSRIDSNLVDAGTHPLNVLQQAS